jgi:hypothetical protein
MNARLVEAGKDLVSMAEKSQECSSEYEGFEDEYDGHERDN